MMTSNAFLLAAALMVSASPAHARQAPSTSPPTTASAEVTQCAQAQMVVDRLLSTANTRLEAARQTNSAADMRAAVDQLQSTLRDVRAQLAPCANVQPATDAHAGHTMPSVQQSPAAAPGTPPMAPAATSPAPAAVAPGAKPPAGAVDPHAGHAMPATKPAPSTMKPSTAKPPAGAKPPADEHAGLTMPAAKPAPSTVKPSTAKRTTSKPPAAAKPPADEHAGHTTPQAAGAATTAVDPVCGLRVNPSTAPSTKHNGQTYYFCSQQHQQLFQKNPAKFLPKQ